MEEIVRLVGNSVQSITGHDRFEKFIADASPDAGDFVLVNNSYVYRKGINTNKSSFYLAFEIQDDGTVARLPQVVQTSNFNNNFKLLSHHGNLRKRYRLHKAVETQLDSLGHLIFVLIGKVDDTVQQSTELNDSHFEQVVLDPTLEDDIEIDEDSLVLRNAFDEQGIWDTLEEQLGEEDENDLENLREKLGVALDRLQSESYAKLQLPSTAGGDGDAIIHEINQVLTEQKDRYRKALEACDSNPEDNPSEYNEILRIAYNFSSDAVTFVRLLQSICDLKPIVSWGTLGEHFLLAEAFGNLPWAQTHRKASLKGYADTIGDARNSAFHDFFPFRKSLEVELPNEAIQDPSLRIFSEHSKKRENELKYKDKELVEVLTQFTRARRRFVPFHFWRQNLEVMNATVELFDTTAEFIGALARKQID